jgi:hypothetical protein
MPKLSLTTLVAVVLLGLIIYLAFNPEVAQDGLNWLRHQVGLRGELPSGPSVAYPNYAPIVPGR